MAVWLKTVKDISAKDYKNARNANIKINKSVIKNGIILIIQKG